MTYNVIRWPDANGQWWLVAETGKDGSYTPLLQVNPKWTSKPDMEPTRDYQLWCASQLLVNKGIDAVDNPHGAIGRTCKCGDCFCCAAAKIVSLANSVHYRK